MGATGVVKMQPRLAAERGDLPRQRVAGERPGGDDHLVPFREIRRLRLHDFHMRVRAQLIGYIAGEALAVHGQRAAGGDAVGLRRLHYQRAQAAHLLFQQPDGVRQVVPAQGVRAHQLAEKRETCAGVYFPGFISTRRTSMPRRASCQAHSPAGEPRADHGDGAHSPPPPPRSSFSRVWRAFCVRQPGFPSWPQSFSPCSSWRRAFSAFPPARRSHLSPPRPPWPPRPPPSWPCAGGSRACPQA